MRRLLLVIALLGFALPGTAAASTTLTPQVTASSVAVRVVIANPGPGAMRVPKTALLPQAFSVTRNGAPVRYVGPIAKTRPADLVIPAHGQRTVTVDLSDAFAFAVTGRYTIALAGARTTAEIAARVPTRAQPSVRTGYTGCSAGEITQIDQALADARVYAASAKAYFDAGLQGSRYTYWFGTYDLTRWTTAKAHFTTMSNVLAAGASISVVCHDAGCSTGMYAFVYKAAHYTVYVCDAFWTAPATGTDSKAGTLIHEFSHFSDIGNTDDHFYGQTQAHLLATGAYAGAPNLKGVAYAVLNADNHEYFAENTPDTTTRTVTVDVATHDFGAQTTGSTTAAFTYTLTAGGDGSVVFGTFTAPSQFTITANTCSGATLAPAATCAIAVAYAPSAAGTISGALGYSANATSALPEIAMSGSASDPVVATPAPVAAPAPAPKVAAQAGRGTLTVTADAATSILLQIKRGTKWVPVRTIAAKPGANVLKLKKGTYRIVTDPNGAAKPGKAIVVR